MKCKHRYYILEDPNHLTFNGYRMFCKYCLYTYIINVPDYISNDQVREYLRLYIIRANNKKDFIL